MLGESFSGPGIKVGKGELLRKLSAIVGAVVFPPAAVAALLDFGTEDGPCLKKIAANQADEPALEISAD